MSKLYLHSALRMTPTPMKLATSLLSSDKSKDGHLAAGESQFSSRLVLSSNTTLIITFVINTGLVGSDTDHNPLGYQANAIKKVLPDIV